MSQSEQHKKGWRRNELGGRECGILPARTDQTRLRQNGDTLCAPKNLKRDKRSADKNSLLLLLLKNNQSIVYQSRRSFLFINRRPNERDETREHETAREKATHAKKKTIRAGVDAYLPFLSVFLVVRFWMMCCCLPSSPFFLSFFGIWEPRALF